jgi:hypothetical protein
MVAGAVNFRALGESGPIGLFGGFDLVLGGGGGFVYGAQTLLGLGMPFGSSVAIGLSSGPGIDGITGGVIPFGVDFPIELWFTLEIGSFMSATAWFQEGWVLASDERDDGSEHAPFGDELSGGLTLAFGERDQWSYSSDWSRPLIGFAYRETMDTAIYELRLGWALRELDLSESY